ncbi:hypothetical protein J4731_10500 [Providencia rettgeri]|nr:hypothetical protein [Providencia rettgeri]
MVGQRSTRTPARAFFESHSLRQVGSTVGHTFMSPILYYEVIFYIQKSAVSLATQKKLKLNQQYCFISLPYQYWLLLNI